MNLCMYIQVNTLIYSICGIMTHKREMETHIQCHKAHEFWSGERREGGSGGGGVGVQDTCHSSTYRISMLGVWIAHCEYSRLIKVGGWSFADEPEENEEFNKVDCTGVIGANSYGVGASGGNLTFSILSFYKLVLI